MEEYFEFLDDLRDSGECNMWGATPYIVREFGVSEKYAGEILVAWIKERSEEK